MSTIFGGNTGLTYEQLQQRRKLAETLRQQNQGTPRNAGEGIHALARALVARGVDRQNQKASERLKSEYGSLWDGLWSDGSGGSYAPASPSSSSDAMYPTGEAGPAPKPDMEGGLAMGETVSPMEPYRNAIKRIESKGSGGYAAVGPTHPKLGRALGAYQIMEANVGPWSREVLGREVTPREFLASPKIQDAIFDAKFGGYVEKFGPEGAAQAWFAGPGGVGKMGRQDSLGTSVADYTRKFSDGMGGGVQVAQNGPMNIQTLTNILSAPDEYVPPGQKAIAKLLLQQQMNASDPMYRLELQNQQLQNEKLRAAMDPNAPQDPVEYGLTPQYVTREDGTLGMIQLGKDGSAKEVDLPEGLALQKGIEKLDLGTSYQWYNTLTGEPIGQPIPKQLREAEAEKAAGRVEGAAEAQKKLDAPAAVAQADESIRLIDQVLNDPALPSIVGKIQGRMDPEGLSGLAMSQEALNLMPKVEQLQGKAFLQAFEGLKGGGQITEREGQAATAAQARIQQRYVDEETYREALNDLKRIASNAKARARGEEVPEYIPSWFDGGGEKSANSDGAQSESGPMTFEQFAADPNVQKAAKKHGVTIEDMWEVQQGAE